MPRVVTAPIRAPFFLPSEDQTLIRKVKEDGGWLSNMSAYPINFEDQKWWHTEALFQALRFSPDDSEVREAVSEPRAPMKSKLIAKKFRDRHIVEPLSATHPLATRRLESRTSSLEILVARLTTF